MLLGAKVTGRAGQVDCDALGIVPVRRAGARQCHRRRARARQGRQFPRRAGEDDRRDRRLSPGRLAVLHRQSRHARRRLHDARLACRCHLRVHQHQSGAALSRQRPAGGGLCDRAAGRSRRRPDSASIRSSCVGATPFRLERMPFKTGLTFTYDTGEFEKNMDMALEVAHANGFEKRRAQSRKHGKLRGLGISNTIERAAAPSYEGAEIRFDRSGAVTMFSGSDQPGPGPRDRVQADRRAIGSASIRTKSPTCRATPTRCSSAKAPAARARRRSAAQPC